MKKADLINAIAMTLENQGQEIAKRDIEAVLTATKDVVTTELAGGGEVAIPELGKFSSKARAARTGRNPQTGEPLEIAAATLPNFAAAKALKDAVNK